MENLEYKICPNCGDDCNRDSAHNGLAMLYGPWGCSCGWSEDDYYNHVGKPAPVINGYKVDSMGGATPINNKFKIK